MAASSSPAPASVVSSVTTGAGVVPPFADVYRDYFAFVWRGVRALRVADHALDDVVQEVFVVAHRQLGAFEGRSSLRTWLAGISLNVVRRHRRTTMRRSPHELSREAPVEPDTLQSSSSSPYEAVVATEATRLLETILADLGEQKREILVLAELQELSAREIADVLGIPLNTVYSRLRLAREAFERSAARYRAGSRRKT